MVTWWWRSRNELKQVVHMTVALLVLARMDQRRTFARVNAVCLGGTVRTADSLTWERVRRVYVQITVDLERRVEVFEVARFVQYVQ